MATLMEKDVLIECISNILGKTAYSIDSNDVNRKLLIDMRSRLYETEASKIDYESELLFINDKANNLLEK